MFEVAYKSANSLCTFNHVAMIKDPFKSCIWKGQILLHPIFSCKCLNHNLNWPMKCQGSSFRSVVMLVASAPALDYMAFQNIFLLAFKDFYLFAGGCECHLCGLVSWSCWSKLCQSSCQYQAGWKTGGFVDWRHQWIPWQEHQWQNSHHWFQLGCPCGWVCWEPLEKPEQDNWYIANSVFNVLEKMHPFILQD